MHAVVGLICDEQRSRGSSSVVVKRLACMLHADPISHNVSGLHLVIQHMFLDQDA